MPSFQILVLGFLFVSFRPSWLRSHSCSTSASLLLLLSGSPLSIRFLSSASLPVLTTQPLFLPFLFLPASASQWLPRCSLSAFASLVFPILSDLVSHVFFPGSSYSAFCLFPFVPPGFAPTAVPPVLPFCFRFRAFPFLPFSFVHFRLGSDYSAFRSFFSLLPVLPCRRFLRCNFSSSVRPVSMSSFRFWYSASCISFLRPLSRLTVATSAPQPSSFRFPAFFPWLRFRFWLLGIRNVSLSDTFRPLRVCCHRSRLE